MKLDLMERHLLKYKFRVILIEIESSFLADFRNRIFLIFSYLFVKFLNKLWNSVISNSCKPNFRYAGKLRAEMLCKQNRCTRIQVQSRNMSRADFSQMFFFSVILIHI